MPVGPELQLAAVVVGARRGAGSRSRLRRERALGAGRRCRACAAASRPRMSPSRFDVVDVEAPVLARSRGSKAIESRPCSPPRATRSRMSRNGLAELAALAQHLRSCRRCSTTNRSLRAPGRVLDVDRARRSRRPGRSAGDAAPGVRAAVGAGTPAERESPRSRRRRRAAPPALLRLPAIATRVARSRLSSAATSR